MSAKAILGSNTWHGNWTPMLAAWLWTGVLASACSAQGYRPPPPVFTPPTPVYTPQTPIYTPPPSMPSYNPVQSSNDNTRMQLDRQNQSMQRLRQDQSSFDNTRMQLGRQNQSLIDSMRMQREREDSMAAHRRDQQHSEAQASQQKMSESQRRENRWTGSSPSVGAGDGADHPARRAGQQLLPPRQPEPAPRALNKEERANCRLHLALQLRSAGLSAKAENWLVDIVTTYPETKAGKEASRLLREESGR